MTAHFSKPARAAIVSFALFAGLLATPSADAQTFGRDALSGRETPQHFALELRIGTYVPNVDDEAGLRAAGATPFADIFGDLDRSNGNWFVPLRWLPAIEFDWQIVRIPPLMSIGIGGSAGFTTIQNRAPFEGMTARSDPAQRSSEITGLQVVPTTLVAVARIDGPARLTNWFPFVPYVKFGLAWTPWWVTNGSGYACDPCVTGSRRDASGAATGIHFGVGLALRLGIFEPHVQRQFDATTGVNHSYAFFEFYNTSMVTQSLNLSLFTWTAGIALEF